MIINPYQLTVTEKKKKNNFKSSEVFNQPHNFQYTLTNSKVNSLLKTFCLTGTKITNQAQQISTDNFDIEVEQRQFFIFYFLTGEQSQLLFEGNEETCAFQCVLALKDPIYWAMKECSLPSHEFCLQLLYEDCVAKPSY